MTDRILNKCCIVLLACRDYESTQLSVAHILAVTPESIPIYFLPNSIETTFESERVKELGVIYSNLYPERFILVNWVNASFPYQAIGDLLYSKQLERFEYVCKVDDDVFPITNSWIEKLADCYEKNDDGHLAYVTGLINNNPWGFAEIVDSFGLKDEYLLHIPGSTYSGKNIPGYMEKKKILPPDIDRGGFGTVWQFPHLAMWIHKKTTLNPSYYIDKTKDLSDKEIDHSLRYSIGCMLFKKSAWKEVRYNAYSDEKLWHLYCMNENKKIIAVRSVPLVHLFFYNQRLSNKTIINETFRTYRDFFKNKAIYIWNLSEENKLYFLEERLNNIESIAGRSRSITRLKLKMRIVGNKIRFALWRGW